MTLRALPPATTLLELAFVLVLLGILLGLAYPPLKRTLDRAAVRGAQGALAAGVARARSVAVARGGAVLVVEPAAARFWVEAGGEVVGTPTNLKVAYGASLSTDGTPAQRIAIRFDGLGIGRVANRTFHLRRGGAEANFTLSAYGRVRTW